MTTDEQRNNSEADRAWAEFKRNGSARALGEVYDALAPELLRVAMHMTRDAAAAEDVLQATFVAAIQRAASFTEGARVAPWLVGILGNEARRLRAHVRRAPDPERLEQRVERAPGDELERRELLEQLDRALERLPEEHRPVLALRVRHGLSASEIAAALGRPSGTVRSQMQRGLEELRRVLPASLAGALVALGFTPARGFGAVREAVIQHAVAAHAAAASVGIAGGVLMIKQVVLLLAVVAASLAVWLAWPERAPSPRAAAAPPTATAQVEPVDEPAEVREQASGRSSVATPTSSDPKPIDTPAPSVGDLATSLAVIVSTPDGEQRVEGEVVLLRAVGADTPAAARTDRNGVALFEDLTPGAAHVQLLRGDSAQLRLKRGERNEHSMNVEAGVEVRGIVIEESGAPVADADLWLSERYRTNEGHVVGKSDREGRFALRWVGVDQSVCAFAEGFAPSALASIRDGSPPIQKVRLVLDRRSVATQGRVIGELGEPIAGARLLVGEERPTPAMRRVDGGYAFGPPPLRVTTDSQGRFELRHLPAGETRVQVRANGYAPFDEARDLTLGGSHSELRLGREGVLRGVVRDEEGAPIARVAVRRGEYNDFGGEFVFSRSDGSFELVGFPAENVRVVVEHSMRGREDFEVFVAPGQVLQRDVVLRATPSLRGRVVDEDGEPLVDWGVLVRPEGGEFASGVSTQTNARGEFAFAEIADEPHTLLVMRHGKWREFPALRLEGLRPSTRPLEIVVEREAPGTATLLARVILPNGEPASGAVLHLWHAESMSSCQVTASVDDGTVEARDVPAGEVSIQVRHPERPWVKLGIRRVAAGERVHLGDVTLHDAARLSATLRGIPEERMAELRVLITDPTGAESGVAHIRGRELASGPLPAGPGRLTLSGDGVATLRVEFEAREGIEQRLDLELAPAGVRDVTFELPADAAPIAWLSCTLVDLRGKLVWSPPWQVRETLRARISALPGEYRLFASTDTGLQASQPVTIESLEYGGAPLLVQLTSR